MAIHLNYLQTIGSNIRNVYDNDGSIDVIELISTCEVVLTDGKTGAVGTTGAIGCIEGREGRGGMIGIVNFGIFDNDSDGICNCLDVFDCNGAFEFNFLFLFGFRLIYGGISSVGLSRFLFLFRRGDLFFLDEAMVTQSIFDFDFFVCFEFDLPVLPLQPCNKSLFFGSLFTFLF
eukprot:523087_1